MIYAIAVYIFALQLFKGNFCIIVLSVFTFSKWSCHLKIMYWNFIYMYIYMYIYIYPIFPHMCYMLGPFHPPWFHDHKKIDCGSNRNNGAFLCAIFCSLIYLRCVFVTSKYYPWCSALLTPWSYRYAGSTPLNKSNISRLLNTCGKIAYILKIISFIQFCMLTILSFSVCHVLPELKYLLFTSQSL